VLVRAGDDRSHLGREPEHLAREGGVGRAPLDRGHRFAQPDRVPDRIVGAELVLEGGPVDAALERPLAERVVGVLEALLPLGDAVDVGPELALFRAGLVTRAPVEEGAGALEDAFAAVVCRTADQRERRVDRGQGVELVGDVRPRSKWTCVPAQTRASSNVGPTIRRWRSVPSFSR